MDRDRELLSEMHLALLSELGAREAYGRLARAAAGGALADALERMRLDQDEQIADLRRLIERLGGRPPGRSRRREVLARLLARGLPLLGWPAVLRLCAQAADQASRWHGYFEVDLRAGGRDDLGEVCGRLSRTKRLHARALETWSANRPPRG